eukprot:gene12766-8705_t
MKTSTYIKRESHHRLAATMIQLPDTTRGYTYTLARNRLIPPPLSFFFLCSFQSKCLKF